MIVNGEIEQLFKAQSKADRKSYFQRIYSKTASLFETTAVSAALISSDEAHVHQRFSKFGYSLGMAFQIIDDIMDFTSDTNKVGKPVGNDLRQGIITLPVIIFAEKNPRDKDITSLVKGKGFDKENIAMIIEKVRNSEAISTARCEANQFVDQAIELLTPLKTGLYKSALLELSNFITERAS
jgi:geranylgeranyl pyrophosphate synthase